MPSPRRSVSGISSAACLAVFLSLPPSSPCLVSIVFLRSTALNIVCTLASDRPVGVIVPCWALMKSSALVPASAAVLTASSSVLTAFTRAIASSISSLVSSGEASLRSEALRLSASSA